MEKDLYAVLGLSPNASPQVIKKTYRKLVQECHPDRYQDRSEEERAVANERMLEITEAFRILGNATERAAYDKKRAGEDTARVVTQTAPPEAARTAAAAPPGVRSKLGRFKALGSGLRLDS